MVARLPGEIAALERAPICESSVPSEAGPPSTFLPSAPSCPIASWTEDYKRKRHATANKRIEGGPQNAPHTAPQSRPRHPPQLRRRRGGRRIVGRERAARLRART